MKFCWCTLTVSDLDKSIAFYRDIVGLPLDRRFSAGPVTEIAFMGGEGAKVELICDKSAKAPERIDGVSLGFEVGSLAEKMGFLKSKGFEIEGPFSPNPFLRFCYVRDPNGVKIQFVENIA